ncbi:MAG: hypothetical protein R3A80_14035 [Bdellovibrionota bacterium]
MGILRLFLFIISLMSLSLSAGEKFLQNSKWNSYVNVISFYHRFYPGIYKALELMPLTQIPEKDFENEIQNTTQEWDQFALKKRGTLADRQSEIQLSRNANERLSALLANNKEFVAIKKVIDSIKSDQRVALTPLDPVFWNSVIGKKAKSDLASIQAEPAQISEVSIKSKKGILDYTLADNPKDKYRIRVLDKGENTLRVKGQLSKLRGPSSILNKDSELKVFDLKGAFYQKKSDRLPFGPYPSPKELYQSEDGATHFRGDGHKHFY